MTTKIKSAEHLEESELNKLLKYLYQNQLWVYYLFVRLGVSVALRYSDLSQITWNMVLGKSNLILKEKKTGKVREIPLHIELTDTIAKVYSQMGCPERSSCIIPLHIRTINKQIKLYAAKAGIRGKRISSHTMRKTFGRLCWDRNNQSEACLVRLSSLFNHSSVQTTRIYLSLRQEEIQNLYMLQDMFVY